MSTSKSNWSIFNSLDRFDASMKPESNCISVAREDRVKRVLELLVDSRCALPPAVIFRNVKFRGADFERTTLDNYINELYDEGLITKVDPDELEKRNVKEIPLSEEGYFIATDKGFKKIQNED